MKKFNHKDFHIETEIETGHDDFIYGNYVDWDRFRKENEDELIEYFDIHLPWGEELTIFEYANFIKQPVFADTSILENYDLMNLPVSKQGQIVNKIRIQFPYPNVNTSDAINSEIFDFFKVPSGIEFEFELPDDLQYWHNLLMDDYFEDEYKYYQKYPLEFRDYKQTILEIHSKVNSISDPLTKKSLVLSSLIISESLLKSIIVNKVPIEVEFSKFSQEILSDEINKKLRGNVEEKNNLFKKLFNKKAPKQNWVNLRNSLAHDIESPTIIEKDILFTNLKENKKEAYSIDKLFEEQIEFHKELQAIIDTDIEQTE